MSSPSPKKSALLIPVDTTSAGPAVPNPLPAVLQSMSSRSASGAPVPLVDADVVEVLATYTLSSATRSDKARKVEELSEDERLLALEAQDGSTVFIRADRLKETLTRLYPDRVTDGQIDLALLRDPEGATRGFGEWIWKQLTVLQLKPDAIVDEALDKAKKALGGKLADALTERLGKGAVFAASTLGAKALMESIESSLAGEEGLYQWHGGGPLSAADLCRKGDPRLTGWGDKPALLFIHGTGSNTAGGFGDLRGSRDWEALERKFGDRIFGLEHRTFSKSPIDNALLLAESLPANARLGIVTHSRGGLVGDLLCLGGFTTETEKLIQDYRRRPRPDEEEAEEADATGELRKQREEVAAEEQEKLRRLAGLLAKKDLRIERYVRVACPAAGTTLLSDNLEVFLSGLLNLARTLGAWGVGAAVGAIATPVAGKVAKEAADQALKLLSRVVLEIADKRLQPQFVPGIEAMLTDAPMGTFLGRAPLRDGVQMAVIAGDIEGGGLLKRIGVMFTDWMFFDRADNDLVVDTGSMYAGLAASNAARALFDQGEGVNHFHYFRNLRTREALRNWLVEKSPVELPGWTPIGTAPGADLGKLVVSRGAREVPPDNTRPVVIYIPGIMGSNLALFPPGKPDKKTRIWMDVWQLANGGLGRIPIGVPTAPDDVVGLAYGKLAEHLEASHRVLRFPYDWRKPLQDAANLLEQVIEEALRKHPDQPVRLLAHSMGGLVARTLFAGKPKLWEAIVQRNGGRLLMLGTPNRGSHLMVETLLGKSNTIRMLGRADLRQSLQEILSVISCYPGALGLLPSPQFTDAAGPAARDYFAASTWESLAKINNDFWFGRQLGGRPSTVDLQGIVDQWNTLDAATLSHPERIAYVFGQSKNTPCGIAIRKDSKGNEVDIEMIGTPHGDGSVTWRSGRLDWLPDDRCWYMPVDHGALINTPAQFDAIVEMLNTGGSSRLQRLPVSRGATEPLQRYNAAPPPGFVNEQEFMLRLVGEEPKALAAAGPERTLAVSVRAMDLRFAQQTLLCGHYIGDPISGAEQSIDTNLVNGALTVRQRLNVYADEIGTAFIVAMPRTQEEIIRGTGQGALIVGLGEFGKLSVEKITETVRAGVLRLLLNPPERQGKPTGSKSGPLAVKLSSVLLGYNSTTHISVDDSVAAVVRGVCEANRQFSDGGAPEDAGAQVCELEFIELYRDAAITAARAVASLPETMARLLKILNTRLTVARELRYGDGVRPRLSLSTSATYWPRMIVTDADRGGEDECSPACFETRVTSPMPPEMLARLLAQHGCTPKEGGAGPCGCQDGTGAGGETLVPTLRYAERLKYVFLSERARAETVVQRRQPGLAESLIAREVNSVVYDKEFAIGRTLFHLLVPLDFKAAARGAHNLLLVLDGYTANIPWEMLQADDEPLAIKTRIVRQLISTRFRGTIRTTRELTAYVVANPSTEGYFAQFGGKNPPSAPAQTSLVSLQSAENEGNAVRAVLQQAGYNVTFAPGGTEANEVIGKLFKRAYRILVIAAHGVFEVRARDGSLRTGVVLSGGVLLTAAEVGQMEVVPELVYLSCCNLGKTNATAGAAPTRLAYSLARELIEMGVRCVVAAGWEVEDQAATTFATTFFTHFIQKADNFGNAIFAARVATYEGHRNVNTWGAYQAYGDPTFTFSEMNGKEGVDYPMYAPEELMDWISTLRIEATQVRKVQETNAERFTRVQARVNARLRDLPPEWSDRPDIQQAMGELYAEFGEAGFDAAREAYLRAVAEESAFGIVPLATVEQLANLEARTAERLGEPKDGQAPGAEKFKEAFARIDRAIARLDQLIGIGSVNPSTYSQSGAVSEMRCANAERWGLLGSAYKRKALLLARQPEPSWKKIEAALKAARDAYQAGESSPDDPKSDPYTMLNRLQLDVLLDEAKAAEIPARVQLAGRCAERARKRFSASGKYFDAVMLADAQLTILLLNDTLLQPENNLTQAYVDAVSDVMGTARKFDSVVKQLRILAQFFAVRGHAKDDERSRALKAVAQELAPIASSPAAVTVPAAVPPVAPARPAKKPAKKRAAKPAKKKSSPKKK